MYKLYFQNGLLERLLFVFKEPFNQEKAINDFNYGGKARSSFKQLLSYEKAIINALINALDAIYLGYQNKEDKFINPPSCINHIYTLLAQTFSDIQQSYQFILTPIVKEINIAKYITLHGINTQKMQDWKQDRGLFIEYKAKLESLCFTQGVSNNQLPYRLEACINDLGKNIEEYRIIKHKALKEKSDTFTQVSEIPSSYGWDKSDKRVYHLGYKDQIKFSSYKTVKYKIFKMIENARGEWVRIRTISLKISKDDNYVRSVVRDLRQMVTPYHADLPLSGEGSVRFKSSQ